MPEVGRLSLLLGHAWETAMAFATTLLVVRLVGKKEVSQMTFWDLVSAIALGSLAANVVIERNTTLWSRLLLIVLWGGLTILIGWVAMKSRVARGVLQGKPSVVIHNGKLLEDTMRAERYNTDLLLSQLRSQGVFNVSDVEFAVLEPHGKLSVLLKAQNLPVTPRDLKLSTSYKGMAKELIMDGQIIEQNLREVGLPEEWLLDQLARQGIFTVARVFHAELSTDGSLYVDRRDDHVTADHNPSDH